MSLTVFISRSEPPRAGSSSPQLSRPFSIETSLLLTLYQRFLLLLLIQPPESVCVCTHTRTHVCSVQRVCVCVSLTTCFSLPPSLPLSFALSPSSSLSHLPLCRRSSSCPFQLSLSLSLSRYLASASTSASTHGSLDRRQQSERHYGLAAAKAEREHLNNAYVRHYCIKGGARRQGCPVKEAYYMSVNSHAKKYTYVV